MFRTVPLSIIRSFSLYTQQWYMSYRFVDSLRAGSGWNCVPHLLRSWVRIPPGAWIFVCRECRVLSGRGLCDELITRPEESYRVWCVVVCDLETSRMGAPYIHDISSLRVNGSKNFDASTVALEINAYYVSRIK